MTEQTLLTQPEFELTSSRQFLPWLIEQDISLGYIRGVSIHGRYAVIGLSKPRHKTFQGLPLDDRLTKEKVEARCGLYVIDLKTGSTLHWLNIKGVVSELYDVITLLGVKRPSMIGFRNDQIRRIITFDQ